MTEKLATVEFTQADRDAAADYLITLPADGVPRMADMFRRGEADHHPLVQAFARHRLNTRPPSSPENLKADELVERAAREIAEELGDDFDLAFQGKSEWNAARGGDPFRDINMPFKHDYLNAAQAVIALLSNISAEDMRERCAKIAANLCADMEQEAEREDSPALSAIHAATAHTADCIAQAIRAIPLPPAVDQRAQVLEEAASYLDTYAGGHYMAKSCAAALRALAAPDAEGGEG